MDKELAKNQNLKERIREALKSFASGDRKQVNQTDPDCAMMHSVQGSHAGYNIQSVVDAVSDANDTRQIDQATELLEAPCKVACADAGYTDTVELEKIDQQEIKVIVPSQRQALHEAESPFSKSHFTYDKEQDCYLCPEGHRLLYSFTDKRKGKRQYRMEGKKFCHRCRHYGHCTKARRGRNIIRLRNEDLKVKLEAQYEEESSQKIYARPMLFFCEAEMVFKPKPHF